MSIENFEMIETRLSKIENMLIGTKEVLSFDEVATYTGLSKSYLYKLTSTGAIPHYKPNGKMCYFNKAEIILWLQKNRVASTQELDNKASTFVTLKQQGKGGLTK